MARIYHDEHNWRGERALVKISGEIAITTQTMNRETYQELSAVLWKQSEIEQYTRLAIPQGTADA